MQAIFDDHSRSTSGNPSLGEDPDFAGSRDWPIPCGYYSLGVTCSCPSCTAFAAHAQAMKVGLQTSCIFALAVQEPLGGCLGSFGFRMKFLCQLDTCEFPIKLGNVVACIRWHPAPWCQHVASCRLTQLLLFCAGRPSCWQAHHKPWRHRGVPG